MRKFISIIAVVLCVACLFSACGKSPEEEMKATCVTVEADANRTEYGSRDAKHTFTYEITEKDGTIKSYIYHTDENTVLEAVKKVGYLTYEGVGETFKVTLKNYEDVENWNFYVNGLIVKDGPLGVNIADNAVYSFVPADYVPAETQTAE